MAPISLLFWLISLFGGGPVHKSHAAPCDDSTSVVQQPSDVGT